MQSVAIGREIRAEVVRSPDMILWATKSALVPGRQTVALGATPTRRDGAWRLADGRCLRGATGPERGLHAACHSSYGRTGSAPWTRFLRRPSVRYRRKPRRPGSKVNIDRDRVPRQPGRPERESSVGGRQMTRTNSGSCGDHSNSFRSTRGAHNYQPASTGRVA
jgi:hypothetical protein